VSIFSFLTGKKDEQDGNVEPRKSPDAAGPGAPVATAAAEPEPPEVAPHAPGTPFTPPEAWNVDALTAPLPQATGEAPEMGPVDHAQTAALQPKIVDVLKTVYDPEIPVDIYELGLVYDIAVDAEQRVLVRMTLTSPACPSAQQIPSEVRYKIKAIPGVADAWVEIVWEPPWDKDRMSEAAKLQLGFF
jgi:FeS assembly SUF system protein